MADLSVAGRIYRNGGLEPATLYVDTSGGLIESIEAADAPGLETHLDFGDQAILPGAIDIHVHFREPGATHKEDWGSGTTSAAFGGVTAVVDMPNTAPPTTTMAALREKLRLASEKAVVDYAAWCGATWFLDDLPEMLQYSPGIKIYLGATTGDLLMDDNDRVRRAMEAAGEAGRPVVLHAEAQRVLDHARRTEERLEDHDQCRPPVAEVEAIYDIMKAVPTMKNAPRIHVAHIASAEAVQAATAAGFSRGVCPHHLLLDVAGCCDETPTHGKMNPPLRAPGAREALWAAYAGGAIPIVESDHAPHTKAEKSEPFHKAPAGIPGVETMLPLLLAKATAGDLPLATVVDSLTSAPAAFLGLDDRGTLDAGKRADFAVFDLSPDAARPVDAADLHSRCGWTPFEGSAGHFPSHVYLAGAPVIVDGALVAAAGSGRPMFPLPPEA